MRLIRAVLVGVENVLLHACGPMRDGIWERRLGLTKDALHDDILRSPAAWRATIGLAVDADVWMELACLYRLHADEVRQLASDFFAGEALDRELLTFLRDLRPRCKTALLSNAWPGARASWAGRHGLTDAADALIISAEVGLAKPDTRIYELAAEHLDVAPEDCLFVDESLEHVAGARDAGMRALRFLNREQVIADIHAALDADV